MVGPWFSEGNLSVIRVSNLNLVTKCFTWSVYIPVLEKEGGIMKILKKERHCREKSWHILPGVNGS